MMYTRRDLEFTAKQIEQLKMEREHYRDMIRKIDTVLQQAEGLASEVTQVSKLVEQDLEEQGNIHAIIAPNLQSVDIESLGLSVRSYNLLRRAGIQVLSDLAGYTEKDLSYMQGMGKRSLGEITSHLEKAGIILPKE